MPITVIGISHKTSPVEVRERFAFEDDAIPEALRRLREAGLAEEAVILSTCNRVEIYAASSAPEREVLARLSRFIGDAKACTAPLTGGWYTFGEPQSIEHLFKVASGLDSLVLGETEILGQLKKAYDLALQHKQTGARLNKAFQRAFNVAKQIRSETQIQRGSISVGSVAVELAEKVFQSLANRHVLVIGAGDTSEKTARALMSRGAGGLLITNRSFERADALARELGGHAVAFDQWPREIDRIDIIISSTSAPQYLIDRTKLESLLKVRRRRPLLLVDIAVPRDIDPEVNLLENVFLYNIDDLQAIADDYLRQRQEEVAQCEAIIREKARSLLQAPRSMAVEPGSLPAYGHD